MRETKNETRRLMSAISTLAGDDDRFGAKGRILADQTASDGAVLLEIVREFSETVLHRHLVFHFESGRSLTVEVAERRALKVVLTADTKKGRLADIYDRNLRAHDVERLLKFLEQETHGETRVSVVSMLPEVFGPDRTDGVSCEALEQRVLSQKEDQFYTTTVSSAVSQTRSLSQSCIVYLRDQQVSELGAQAHVSGLKQLYQEIASNITQNGAKAWISNRSSNQSVLRVKHDDLFLLSLMGVGEIAECVKLWSALRSQSKEH